METKTMGPRNLGFVLSEANGGRSYDTVTIAAGAGKLVAGTVLGALTAGAAHTASPAAEVEDLEGAETATAILAYGVDATDVAVEAVVLNNDAEVKKDFLVFHASVDTEAKVSAKHDQLRLRGIKVR